MLINYMEIGGLITVISTE